jgi:hypothetical protein
VAGELDPVLVLRALARPGVGDELHRLGVRDLSTFGGEDVYVPPKHKSWVRELVEQALAPPASDNDVASERPRRSQGRGRSKEPVWEREANRAARIYIRNGELTPYGVWVRYNPKRVKQTDKPKLLSKNMVGHLLTAIDRGWLPWDAAERRLVISGEFRAGRGKFVIPRSKPAS